MHTDRASLRGSAAATPHSADLVVLGGGPAGLTAAWLAARRGLSVTLLERAAQPGGMAASFEVAGIRVDAGSHRLHPSTPPHLMAALRGLLGADLQTRPRHGRLRVYDRWVGFPLRPAELASTLPPAALARLTRDALCQPFTPRRAGSYRAVLTSRLGPELYTALYEPYARKLWGLDGAQIDPAQASRRVSADSPWKIARRMLRRERSGQGHLFHYPRRGFGQLVESVAAAATAAGAQLRCQAPVAALRVAENQVIVRTTDGTEVRAGHVFVTLPLPVLARLISPQPAPAVLDAASRLRFRAMVLVYLVHEGGRWTGYDAHYLPGLQTPVSRVSEPANYRSSVEDPVDRSVLCAELPGAVGDRAWTATDDELAELVRGDLLAAGLPPVRLGGVVVRRLPHVYPVYRQGYGQQLAELDRWADGLDRVTPFGRLGLFAHDNTHHAMAMAWDAVDALGRDGVRDAARWAAARRRFARHVVED